MSPDTDGLAGDLTTEEGLTGPVAYQAQSRVTEPVPAGGLRGGAAALPRTAAAPQTSRPAGSPTPLPGGTSTGLRGADWRKAAAKASRRRPAKAAPGPAAKVAIPPAPTAGARLTATARCLSGCDWTAGPGDPAEVDKAAERHTTKPPKHPTNTVSVVAEIGGAA